MNTIASSSNSRTIALTRGHVALVDAEDFERLSSLKWTYVHKRASTVEGDGYATHYYRVGKKVFAIAMHRLILNAPARLSVDHINGNGLDNRKSNLRICTHAENLRNQRRARNKKSSRYKGVYRQRGGRFFATISVDRSRKYLGRFNSEVEAAEAYDRAALTYHGEFAMLNFDRGRYLRAAA